jgi:sugar lactone lactonase YvrE
MPHSMLIAALAFAAASTGQPPAGRIYFLDIKAGRVLSANSDGSDLKVLLDTHKTGPDGIAIDPAGRHIYWTNMGRPSDNDGSIERMDLDGRNLTTIVPAGGTFTPKQLKLDARNRKLYWSDREGMRVMRANLDGSNVETLIETGQGDEARRDARNWCVGIGADADRGMVYWTQKGASNSGTGSLRRAPLAHLSEIETLFDELPEPIDLDLDLSARMVYWTDRGDPPRGNTVSRASMDAPRKQEILIEGLKEGIGIALDLKGGRMFITDLGGNVYSAKLDGTDRKTILTGQGNLTGIAYVETPR